MRDEWFEDLDDIANTPIDMMTEIALDDPRAKPRDFAKRLVETGGKIYVEPSTGMIVYIGGDMDSWCSPPPHELVAGWQ